MTDIKHKKENVKMHLKDLRQNLKKMHLSVTEELILPHPDEVKTLMNKMDQLLKLIESK
jgi:SUMO ligase MMS21 Smc5/6 complex component